MSDAPIDWTKPLRIAQGSEDHRPDVEVVAERENPEHMPPGSSYLIAWQESNGEHYAFVSHDGSLIATFHGGGNPGDPWVENAPYD